ESDSGYRFKIYQKESANFQKKKLVRSFGMPLNYEYVIPSSQGFFESWFQISDQFKLTYNNYFRSQIKIGYYEEDQFLNYVIGIEVYHRKKYVDIDLRDEKYLQIRDRIVSGLEDKRDQEWLNARLNR